MLDHLYQVGRPDFHRLAGQRGVVIGIGGAVVGAELFGSTTGLAARWNGMLEAATLDSLLAPDKKTTASSARSFVRALGKMTLEGGGEAGMAAAVTSERGSLVATGLGFGHTSGMIFDDTLEIDRVLQLSVFDAAHPLMEGAWA